MRLVGVGCADPFGRLIGMDHVGLVHIGVRLIQEVCQHVQAVHDRHLGMREIQPFLVLKKGITRRGRGRAYHFLDETDSLEPVLTVVVGLDALLDAILGILAVDSQLLVIIFDEDLHGQGGLEIEGTVGEGRLLNKERRWAD